MMPTTTRCALAGLQFDNTFTQALPADPIAENYRRQVTGAAYSRVTPTPVAAPHLVAVAAEVAALLDLTPADCASPEFLQVFAGNALLPGMDPFAMCYGGHQFGHWAGQLGDGRAINLGETLNQAGERWTLQLKGAGATPYSRSADGLAVLRSSIREFLCSEAMHHLGVPTTRALCLIGTGEPVVRDMFYDGHARAEPGAVVCRVAPHFTRFGNFQLFAARGENELLQALLDHTLRTDFPHLGPPSPAVYLEWLADVATRTAHLIAHWMRVGFVHGVMNTDNLSVLGLTIDYGPYGWLENYDPDWTPNTTDAQHKRYRYGQQPQIAWWNLVQLANALHALVPDVPGLEAALAAYPRTFEATNQAMLAAKLGLVQFDPAQDSELVGNLYRVLSLTETDMTLFYRALAEVPSQAAISPEALLQIVAPAWYQPASVTPAIHTEILAWLDAWRARLGQDQTPDEARRARMQAVNPLYVLRNYLAQEAIDLAEVGDYSRVVETLEVLRRPYEEQPGRAAYAAKRPEWARQRAGCSMLSCSS